MKIIFCFLAFVSFSTLGCSEEEDILTSIDGDYSGTFERDGKSANVSFTFEGGSWTGESETVKFPALCGGRYSISGNTVHFENTCIWTAEFDWSLVLNDDWEVKVKGHSLVLKKSNGDRYWLMKE